MKLEDPPSLAIVRELRCPHADHGCLFVGSSEQGLLVHLNTCGYVHMTNQTRALTAQITMRDQEILRLNAALAQESRRNEFHIKETAQQILATVSSKLEKIDENSQRVLEDARSSMLKTKSAVQSSPAFQQSLTAMHNLRQAVEQAVTQARAEILAKFNELELAAGKLNTMIHKHVNERTDASRTALPSPPAPASDDGGAINNAWPSESSCYPAEVPAVPEDAEEPVFDFDEVDEEMKNFLLVSREAYKRELQARADEEVQIQQALRLSLLDARSGQQ